MNLQSYVLQNIPGLCLSLNPSHIIFLPQALNPLHFCNTVTVSYLPSFPQSDIAAWTDGVVPGGLGKRGARIHIKSIKCLTAVSLSFLIGCWATSYNAKTHAILHA